MTQEQKELLLKDLCARLLYGVIVNVKGFDYDYNDKLTQIYKGVGCLIQVTTNMPYDIEQIKPYLFPLSSMTEDMMEELNANGFFKYRDSITNVSHLESKNGISEEIYTYIDIESISFLTEYFHSHHIDYRGLIEKGLALDATGLNIY